MSDLITILTHGLLATLPGDDEDVTAILAREIAEELAARVQLDGWAHVPPGSPSGLILEERLRQRSLGYTPEHDDEEGLAHLVQGAHHYLGHMGEVASPESVRHDLLAAGALIVAALEWQDRNES